MSDTAVVDVPTTSTPAPSSPTSSTPASAVATPAVAATPTTPPASERPTDAKSLSKFLQAADAAADATTPQSPLVADPGAAPIVPTTDPTKAGAVDPNVAKGPIPFEAHQTALANARTKAVADYRQQYGWAEKVDRKAFEETSNLAKHLSTNTVGFYNWLGEQIRQHPVLSQQLQGAPPAAPVKKPVADVQIIDQAGNVVGMTYSEKSQAELLNWELEQRTGSFTKMLQPLLKDRDDRIQQEKVQTEQKALNARADGVMAQVTKILRMDGLSEAEKADRGKKLLDEMQRTPNAIEAALVVFERDVVPSLEKKGQQAALDTNLKKAAANTANGNGAAATTGRPKNAKELAKFMEAHDL